MKAILLLFIFFTINVTFTQEKAFTKLTNAQEKLLNKVNKKNSLQLTNKNEKGEKLIINIQFLNSKTLKPLQNKKVFFYQATVDGNYYPEIASNQKTARIKGSVFTNNKGKVLLRTILPGNYSKDGDTRHIHLQFINANPKNYDIFFKQFSSNFVKNHVVTNETMYLLDLKKNSKNNLVGFLTVYIKNPN